MTALLNTDARNVLNMLLLHLNTHRARVLAGVKIVAGIKRSVNIESEQHIVGKILVGFVFWHQWIFFPG